MEHAGRVKSLSTLAALGCAPCASCWRLLIKPCLGTGNGLSWISNCNSDHRNRGKQAKTALDGALRSMAGQQSPKRPSSTNSGLPHSSRASQKGHRAISHSPPPNLDPAWKGKGAFRCSSSPSPTPNASRRSRERERRGWHARPSFHVVRLAPKPTTATQDG
jgi:hypothetical protein